MKKPLLLLALLGLFATDSHAGLKATTGGTLQSGSVTPGNCASWTSNGTLQDAGAPCGSGSGTVTTTGSPANGNLTQFSGATSITNGDLSGDITTSSSLATTVAKIQGITVSGTTGTGNVCFSASPTFTGTVNGAAATWSGNNTAATFIPTGSSAPANGMYLISANLVGFAANTAPQFAIGSTASAVNYVIGVGAATGFFPTLQVAGSDGGPGLNINTKSTGGIFLNTNSGTNQVSISHTGSAVDRWNFTGAATGNPGIMVGSAIGTDTNVTERLTPKGAGTVDIAGHLSSTNTSPTMGSCGSSPSVSGTDTKGVITTGTGAPTACTLNFGTTYASTPVCVITTSSTTALGDISAISTSAFTVTLAVGLTSGSIYYICLQ